MLLHQLIQFAEALKVDVATLVPELFSSPAAIQGETRHSKDDYLTRLRELAAGRAEQERFTR